MYLLVFGDSITYGLNDEKGGWVNRLRKELEKDNISNASHVRDSVYNCGIRGDTTEDLLKRFDAECSARVEREDNPIILFAIGTNDSSTNTKGLNIIPIETYRLNLTKLFEKAKIVSDRIMFISLFPADETKTKPINWKPDRLYTNKSLEVYNSSIKEFCKEKNMIFVDLFKPIHKKAYQELLSDGLHPNSKGHQKIYKLVIKALEKNGWVTK